MAILYNVGSDYSKGIAETIKSEFEKSGGKIVEYASYNDGDKDFSAQLTNVKKSNPDIIALPDYYNAVSYTHLTLPTNVSMCRSRWSPYH